MMKESVRMVKLSNLVAKNQLYDMITQIAAGIYAGSESIGPEVVARLTVRTVEEIFGILYEETN